MSKKMMERKGRFTRGPAEVSQTEPDAKVKTSAGYINVGDTLYHKENIANASLIASAFNAATACEDMGYDGEACVKALPELIVALNGLARAYASTPGAITANGSWHSHAVDILAKCRG